MSFVKNIMAEQEELLHNQLEGYRKHLISKKVYNMDCPYCSNALSNSDAFKENCLHCGHDLPWNKE